MAKTSTAAPFGDLPRQEWFTLRAVARYCGTSYWTVMKWVRAGTLPTKKSPGNKHMVRRRDMEALFR